MKTKPTSPKTISPALWGGLACLVLALVLELLPTGVVLMFADGPGQQIPQSFSYFDLTPVGYGAWFPMLIGAATVLALILGLLCLWQRNARGLFTAWLACVGIGGALSLLHLLFSALLTGQFSPTIPECGILILLLAACWLVSKARWAMAAPLQHS